MQRQLDPFGIRNCVFLDGGAFSRRSRNGHGCGFKYRSILGNRHGSFLVLSLAIGALVQKIFQEAKHFNSFFVVAVDCIRQPLRRTYASLYENLKKSSCLALPEGTICTLCSPTIRRGVASLARRTVD